MHYSLLNIYVSKGHFKLLFYPQLQFKREKREYWMINYYYIGIRIHFSHTAEMTVKVKSYFLRILAVVND